MCSGEVLLKVEIEEGLWGKGLELRLRGFGLVLWFEERLRREMGV